MSTSSSEPVDQASSDATKSSIDTSEQAENLEKQPSVETAVSCNSKKKTIKDNNFSI